MHLDDRRGKDQPPVGAVVHEEHLVEPERLDVTEAMLVVEEHFAIAQECVVDGVPHAAQFFSDLLHTAPVLTNLLGEPATRSLGHRVTREGNANILLDPRTHRTGRPHTAEPALVPDQANQTAVNQQAHEGHERSVLHPRHHPTL